MIGTNHTTKACAIFWLFVEKSSRNAQAVAMQFTTTSATIPKMNVISIAVFRLHR